MECSNPNVDPELRDPLLDLYHVQGAIEPMEIQNLRKSQHRHTFPVDITN